MSVTVGATVAISLLQTLEILVCNSETVKSPTFYLKILKCFLYISSGSSSSECPSVRFAFSRSRCISSSSGLNPSRRYTRCDP